MSDTKQPTRHIPDLDFYNFTNTELPKLDFYITDIDAIIRDKSGRFMIVEKKCKNYEFKPCQEATYDFLHQLILNSAKQPIKLPSLGITTDWSYYGFHLLQFENTSFENGKVFFNRQEITKSELVQVFNFTSDRVKVLAQSK